MSERFWVRVVISLPSGPKPTEQGGRFAVVSAFARGASEVTALGVRWRSPGPGCRSSPAGSSAWTASGPQAGEGRRPGRRPLRGNQGGSRSRAGVEAAGGRTPFTPRKAQGVGEPRRTVVEAAGLRRLWEAEHPCVSGAVARNGSVAQRSGGGAAPDPEWSGGHAEPVHHGPDYGPHHSRRPWVHAAELLQGRSEADVVVEVEALPERHGDGGDHYVSGRRVVHRPPSKSLKCEL